MTTATDLPVVAGVDCSSRSRFVLEWADEQARLTGAPLVALTAWGSGVTDDPGDVALADATRRAARIAADDALPPDRSAALTVRVDPADPVRALIRAADDAGILVLGAHHVHPLRPLGSVPARVIGRAACPVAVVRPREHRRTDRIVVGLDGSPASRAALRWAIGQGDRTGAKVSAVLAWEWAPEYPVHPYSRPTALFTEQKEAWLDAELAELPAGLAQQVHPIVLEGSPPDVLDELARGADLVVVGTHAGPGRFMGSVSHTLARRSHTPVVVVPPPRLT
jgi:nucleotide-binding universal stress UspA family protein